LELKHAIKKLAGQCVKCGVCAPHCPTYVKTQHEGESARGRIALMEAYASDQLPLSNTLLSHLDSCLYCRACEAVCPSDVSYAALLNTTHQLIGKTRPFSKYLDFIFKKPQHLRWVVIALRVYQRTGLQWLARKTKLLRLLRLERWDQYLPSLHLHRWRPVYPSASPHQGQVTLFSACIASFAEVSARLAAIRLLNTWGFDVYLPAKAHCCGAFHLHGGSPHFITLAKENMQQLNTAHPILFITPGCGMILKDYPTTCAHFPHANIPKEHTEKFSQPLEDIATFLTRTTPTTTFTFKTLNAKIAVHSPCAVSQTLKTGEAWLSLLQRIPGAQCLPIQTPTRCCGAAGLSMLTQPNMADNLAQDIIEAVTVMQPAILVTANIGCRLHLSAQFRAKKINIPILHPLELLAAQLV